MQEDFMVPWINQQSNDHEHKGMFIEKKDTFMTVKVYKNVFVRKRKI
jgi:hypothetical protein